MVTAENNYDFDWYCCVGYHITGRVNEMFGGNETEFGFAMINSVDRQSYKNSLTRNLSDVVEKMQDKVTSSVEDPLRCDETPSNSSHINNKTSLNISNTVVDECLKSFTEETGIPMVIVVDEAEDVFGKYVPFSDIVRIVLSLIILGVAIVFIVRAVKRNKNGQNGNNNSNNNNGNNNGGYNNNGYNNNGYNNGGYNGGYN